jgi:2,6-dihydroxypseudooxynicotine hydrolase
MEFDGPGQGEALAKSGLPFGPNAHTAISAGIDLLETRTEIDHRRLGVVGRSLGGYLATRAAADDPRVGACVAWPGNYDMSNFDTRPALNRLGYQFITASKTMEETSEIIRFVTMEGAAQRVQCPLYILHGGLDSIAPLAGAHRLAREVAGPVEMVVYDDGIHCNHDMAHVVRPAMADWLLRQL